MLYIYFTAVLLHIGNEHPSIPIAYSTSLGETYDALELILNRIDYRLHKWKICCDLKVVQILVGLRPGYIKHQCFICEFEGHSEANTYSKKKWKKRDKASKIGEKSIIAKPLVEFEDIILPALHIKLGLITSFVKNLQAEALNELAKMFEGHKTADRIKKGFFDIYFHIYFQNLLTIICLLFTNFRS